MLTFRKEGKKRKGERSQRNLNSYLRKLNKEEHNILKIIRRKKLIKTREEINETESRKTKRKIDEIKIWSFIKNQ